MGRLKPDERREQLLDSAVNVAQTSGFDKMTHVLVAQHANVSKATVFKYFETINILKREVLSVAIKKEILTIIAVAVVSYKDVELTISQKLKEKALASI